MKTKAARPTGDAERRTQALQMLGAMAPALGRCLPGVHGSVPVWLRVGTDGTVVAARFDGQVSKDAAACARGVLVGQAVAEAGPVEELLADLSLR